MPHDSTAPDSTAPGKDFTPALGRFAPTRFYDLVIALFTRERTWRDLAVRRLAPEAGELVVDIGCGTGSLALLLKRAHPGVRIIGVDPDAEVLALARRKAGTTSESGTGTGPGTVEPVEPVEPVEWIESRGDRLHEVLPAGSADAVVSTLVLHQCPLPVKKAILAAAFTALRPGGRLVVADYGLQRTRTMRLAFRLVQMADGKEDTQPNADGVLPGLITAAGFADVQETAVVPTFTGSISVLTARRPESAEGEQV